MHTPLEAMERHGNRGISSEHVREAERIKKVLATEGPSAVRICRSLIMDDHFDRAEFVRTLHMLSPTSRGIDEAPCLKIRIGHRSEKISPPGGERDEVHSARAILDTHRA